MYRNASTIISTALASAQDLFGFTPEEVLAKGRKEPLVSIRAAIMAVLKHYGCSIHTVAEAMNVSYDVAKYHCRMHKERTMKLQITEDIWKYNDPEYAESFLALREEMRTKLADSTASTI